MGFGDAIKVISTNTPVFEGTPSELLFSRRFAESTVYANDRNSNYVILLFVLVTNFSLFVQCFVQCQEWDREKFGIWNFDSFHFLRGEFVENPKMIALSVGRAGNESIIPLFFPKSDPFSSRHLSKCKLARGVEKEDLDSRVGWESTMNREISLGIKRGRKRWKLAKRCSMIFFFANYRHR